MRCVRKSPWGKYFPPATGGYDGVVIERLSCPGDSTYAGGASGAPVTRVLPIAALALDPLNPRTMPDGQMSALARSIREFGFVEPVVVRRSDHLVIGGHQRIEAARRVGLTEIPVVEVDLTDEQCRALNVALNRIHGEWDVPKLAEILAALPADLASLTGFDEEAMRRVIYDAELAIRALQEDQDLDEIPEPPDEATTKPGDLWILGRHRLLCSDSGDPAAVDRLLDGAPVHVACCDPPYAVRVEPRSNNAIRAGLSSFTAPKNRHHQALDLARHPEKATATHAKMRAKDRPLLNDFVSDEEFERLLHAWFGNIARVLPPAVRSGSGEGTRTARTTRPCSRHAGSTSARASSG